VVALCPFLGAERTWLKGDPRSESDQNATSTPRLAATQRAWGTGRNITRDYREGRLTLLATYLLLAFTEQIRHKVK
jgi:hypothetical protein